MVIKMYKTSVKIEGMMCGNCEKHMNEAFKAAFSPKEVKSSHEEKVSVLITDSKPEEEKIRLTVEETGYRFISMEAEEIEKKRFGLFHK